MKRKFFTAVASVASFLLIGAMMVEAADVTFGGRVRPRYEMWNNAGTGAFTGVPLNGTGLTPSLQGEDTSFVDMLVRLNANVKLDEKTSAFIQFQMNNRWGSTAANAPGASASNVNSPNDVTTDVGVHQAYFVLKDFFGVPVDLQVGRQEVILDGHRLLGNTVWTQGMQSHDGIVLTHGHGNHVIKYVYSKAIEASARGAAGAVFGGASNDDVDDLESHIVWANLKGLIGSNSSTSLYFILTDQDNNTPNLGAGSRTSADFYTLGARQAGQIAGFDYRGEFYYQTGKSIRVGASGDLSAYLIGLRVGKKFNSVMWKPGVTLWWDYLSGTSASDAAAGDDSTFKTLYDTGHKYYGLMDFFLSGVNANGTHPGTGLVDYAIKFSIEPLAKTTLKVDLHHFEVAEDDVITSSGSASGPSTLGQEIDVTLVHKYSANTTISAGYSHFFARELLAAYGNANVLSPTVGVGSNNTVDADWLYVMFDVKW